MDLMEIYCTIRWVSEISWRRHKLFIPRVSQRTWLRHGLYPTGISFVVDEPDGDTGSIQRGSAIWLMDRVDAGQYPKGVCCMVQLTGQRQGQYPKGVCYMVDGPDWESPWISAIWIWSLDLTNIRRNGALYHLVSEQCSMEPLDVWLAVLNTKPIGLTRILRVLGKGKAILPLIDLFTSKTVTTHLFTLGYD